MYIRGTAEMENKMKEFSWAGSERHFVDEPNLQEVSGIIVGRFGGNSHTGQSKNEDACLVWANESEDWEFVMVLDAHNTAESAELVLKEFEQNRSGLRNLLKEALTCSFFKRLEELVLSIFQRENFRNACREIQGETACMIVVRKGKYVWWLSIGDCVLYLFHRELASMGQYQLNQRHFYEWVGQVNTFDQLVPCFSSGTKELRNGQNHLFVTTDGLLECPGEPYANPQALAGAFADVPHCDAIHSLLKTIEKNGIRDSTTVVSWKVDVSQAAAYASNQ
jgi:hypothetical protein